jgi:hypothetical protein
MIHKNFIVLLCCLFFWSGEGFSQTPPPTGTDSHWVNQWTDDFTNPSFTQITGASQYWIGTSPTDPHWLIADNWEFSTMPQVFLKDNISFDYGPGHNGLIIKTNKLATPYYCASCVNHHVFDYASGSITRYGDFPTNIQYGYLESEIKIERDVYGLWPAFWLWSDSRPNYYNCSYAEKCTCNDQNGIYDYDEVDIFELTPGAGESCANAGYNNVTQNKYITRTNIHTCDNEVGCGTPNIRGQNLPVADYTQWHRYGIEWSPSKIVFYIDGRIIRDSPNPGYEIDGQGSISRKLNIIINSGLNQYLHGDYWSYPFSNYFNSGTYSPANIDVVPCNMYVRSVSYWKLNLNGAYCISLIDQNINSSTINNFDNKIDKSYTTSGTIFLPSSKIWRASEYILINGDFDSNGKDLYLDVNPCTE